MDTTIHITKLLQAYQRPARRDYTARHSNYDGALVRVHFRGRFSAAAARWVRPSSDLIKPLLVAPSSSRVVEEVLFAQVGMLDDF